MTPLLCGILAAGMARRPFYRGLAVGITSAIKPTFGLLIPFVGIAFGPWALLGGVIGFLPAVIHVPWFFEYLRFMPEVSERFFACPSLVRYLGATGSLALTSILCLVTSVIWRHRESTYVVLIGIVTVGTALWPHSYCPLVIPICYVIGYWSRSEPAESTQISLNSGGEPPGEPPSLSDTNGSAGPSPSREKPASPQLNEMSPFPGLLSCRSWR